MTAIQVIAIIAVCMAIIFAYVLGIGKGYEECYRKIFLMLDKIKDAIEEYERGATDDE